MSLYEIADQKLVQNFWSDYKKLAQLVNKNPEILGQFVEYRLRDWLKSLTKFFDLEVGTGYVLSESSKFDDNVKKGQCDVVVYENPVEFQQNDLVVVHHQRAWILIEVKANMNIERTLVQIGDLRKRSPNAFIYLFAIGPNTSSKDTIIKKLQTRAWNWELSELPDSIIVLNEPPYIIDIYREITAETLVEPMKPLLASYGIPYDGAVALAAQAMRSTPNVILSSFARKLIEDFKSLQEWRKTNANATHNEQVDYVRIVWEEGSEEIFSPEYDNSLNGSDMDFLTSDTEGFTWD